MGADLYVYGNHNLNFKNIKYENRSEIIIKRLSNFRIINEDHIKALMIYWEKSILQYPDVLKDKIIKCIERIRNFKNYNWSIGINIEEGYKTNNLYGFLDFVLEFSNDKIYFRNQPPYRYLGWFSMDKIIRNEWRKYLFQMVNVFGGNRVIYLPDNMSNAEKYQDYFDLNDSSFNEIENELINEYGKNNYKLSNMTEDDGNEYYIDYFDDLQKCNNMSTVEFVKYLEDENFNGNKHFYFA